MQLNKLLSICRFHARRQWQTRPFAFAALAASMCIMLLVLGHYVQRWEERQAAEQEWQALNERMPASVRADSPLISHQVVLSEFQSKHLVDAIHRVAQETKLPIDEVSFSLDDNGNLPYLRYRATLTVSSGYPVIRRFLDLLREEISTISLDTISCTRIDIGARELTCDLALSAFYRRGMHG